MQLCFITRSKVFFKYFVIKTVFKAMQIIATTCTHIGESSKKNYENCNKHILLKNIPVLMADKFCPQSLKDVPRHFPVKGAKNTQNI